MPFPHKFVKLTPEERKKVSVQLQQLVREGKNKGSSNIFPFPSRISGRERIRLQVIHLSDSGLTFQQIVKQLPRMSYMTVRRCVYTYEKEGIECPYFRGKI